jgi:hypothetical protein
MPEIVGRDHELRTIERFFDPPRAGPRAIVLEGGAGIGKSTLWHAGVETARASGFRVFLSRPAEAESGLAHVVLSDLFEDALRNEGSVPAETVAFQILPKGAPSRTEVPVAPGNCSF